MDITIRKANIVDLKTIQTLNLKLFEKENKEFDESLDVKWTFSEEGTKYFLDRITRGFAIIAESNNAPVGYLVGGEAESPSYRTIEKIAEIDNMFVLEEFRQKGIGKKLFDAFLEWCRKNGYQKLKVEASAKNKGAIGFYKKLGFSDYTVSLEKDIF